MVRRRTQQKRRTKPCSIHTLAIARDDEIMTIATQQHSLPTWNGQMVSGTAAPCQTFHIGEQRCMVMVRSVSLLQASKRKEIHYCNLHGSHIAMGLGRLGRILLLRYMVTVVRDGGLRGEPS
jgi:hypothetical protein